MVQEEPWPDTAGSPAPVEQEEDLALDQDPSFHPDSPKQEQVDPLAHVVCLQGFPLVGIWNPSLAPKRHPQPDDRQMAMWREAHKDCQVSKVPVDET